MRMRRVLLLTLITFASSSILFQEVSSSRIADCEAEFTKLTKAIHDQLDLIDAVQVTEQIHFPDWEEQLEEKLGSLSLPKDLQESLDRYSEFSKQSTQAAKQADLTMLQTKFERDIEMHGFFTLRLENRKQSWEPEIGYLDGLIPELDLEPVGSGFIRQTHPSEIAFEKGRVIYRFDVRAERPSGESCRKHLCLPFAFQVDLSAKKIIDGPNHVIARALQKIKRLRSGDSVPQECRDKVVHQLLALEFTL